MNIRSITSIGKEELQGKTVLVRVDFNVQVYEGKILDDLRIKKTLPTIVYLREQGARLVLVSHNESKDGTGLKPVCDYINTVYQQECGTVRFIADFMSPDTKTQVENLKDGEVILFENLRVNPGEKANDPHFAEYLASMADMYVNDAFAVSHRAHASVVGISSLFPEKKFAGLQLLKEVEHLVKACAPEHPFIFILGGAKFETKLP
jgi:phosphoglycerate kinase